MNGGPEMFAVALATADICFRGWGILILPLLGGYAKLYYNHRCSKLANERPCTCSSTQVTQQSKLRLYLIFLSLKIRSSMNNDNPTLLQVCVSFVPGRFLGRFIAIYVVVSSVALFSISPKRQSPSSPRISGPLSNDLRNN